MKLATISAPETDYNHPDKGDALHAMEIALALEKLNFQFLYKLHKVLPSASAHGLWPIGAYMDCPHFSAVWGLYNWPLLAGRPAILGII